MADPNAPTPFRVHCDTCHNVRKEVNLLCCHVVNPCANGHKLSIRCDEPRCAARPDRLPGERVLEHHCHHEAHRLSFCYQWDAAAMSCGGHGGRPLKIECVRQPKCVARGVPAVQEVENCQPHLVTAVVIAFHAMHEGHPLRITFGDDVIESPAPAQTSRR